MRKICYNIWNLKRKVRSNDNGRHKRRPSTEQQQKQEAANAHEVIQADIVATFGRKARVAALVAGATMEQALEAEEKAAAEAEASMTDASAMRE